MEPFCAAIDWGTSNCRIWLLDDRGGVLSRETAASGMAAVRPGDYCDLVEALLGKLNAPGDLPVIICGMAGSRNGWREAPYIDTPARVEEFWCGAVRPRDARRTVFILPGVSQRDCEAPDAMRGEETQIAGARALGRPDGLYCLPGTHCKWVLVKNGRIERFHTFLTGELFALIVKHSVLGNVLQSAGDDPPGRAFADAVDSTLLHPEKLSRELFGIRAGVLIDDSRKSVAKNRLSGLLIGAEIAGARQAFGGGGIVRLVRDARLGPFYEAALARAGFTVEAISSEEATIRGLFLAASHLFSPHDAAFPP